MEEPDRLTREALYRMSKWKAALQGRRREEGKECGGVETAIYEGL